MAKKKTKKSLESDQHGVSVPTIYSNVVGIGYGDTDVVINFGFSTPSYFEPNDDEDTLVARIVLSWKIADNLSASLQDIISDHKKEQEPKRKAKRKSGGGKS
jgi:hypothetical protein